MKLPIIFENDQFIVLNKPAGLLSIPDRTQSQISLKDMLRQKYSNIFTVHRLDRETSGIIVFAKEEATHKELSQLFEGREVEKYYEGLVHGILDPQSGSIDAPIMEHPGKKGTMIIHAKGKPSLTDYEALESFRSYTWTKFRIHTGRTHQIRVHLTYIGHSLVCDELYGDPQPIYVSALKRNYNLSKKEEEERPILKRIALHSSSLKFTLNNEIFEFTAEAPKDLRALLQQLRKRNKV